MSFAKAGVIKGGDQPQESLACQPGAGPGPAWRPGMIKVSGLGEQVNQNIAAAAAGWSFLTI